MLTRLALIASAASAAAVLATAPALAQEMGGARHFMKTAVEGDNSEMMLGRLAERRASDPGVRDFGRTLVLDHRNAKDQAAPLAGRFHLASDRDVAPQARHEAQKLQHMDGPAFDREFARYMVQDHQKDIADFKRQAHRQGPVADMARQTLPTLHKHLQIAEQLQQKLQGQG